MKTSHKVILVCAFLTLALASQKSVAQSADVPGMTPATPNGLQKPANKGLEIRFNKMSQQLALTAEQQKAIKPILEDESNKLQAMRIDKNLSAAERKAKLHELRENTFNKIHFILNPEQQQKQEAIRKELLERRQKMDAKQPR